MRDFKFRFWNKTSERFEYDNLDSRSSYQNPFSREDLITCQFTGLLDTKGKEIWEGDLVKTKWSPKKFNIKFGEGVFLVSHTDKRGIEYNLYLSNFLNEIEVVGNIFEGRKYARRNY